MKLHIVLLSPVFPFFWLLNESHLAEYVRQLVPLLFTSSSVVCAAIPTKVFIAVYFCICCYIRNPHH
jgi:hypothetical protein